MIIISVCISFPSCVLIGKNRKKVKKSKGKDVWNICIYIIMCMSTTFLLQNIQKVHDLFGKKKKNYT